MATKKELISYENSKCSCCDKVYMTFFVVNSTNWKDTKYVVCFDCAQDISFAMKSLLEKTARK